MFNQEVIDKIRRSEMVILICMAGEKSTLPGLAVGLEKCCACQGVVHYDLANKAHIESRGLNPICHRCFIDSGLFAESLPDFEEEEALIGGQSLTMEEGIEAVKAMVNPPKEVD